MESFPGRIATWRSLPPTRQTRDLVICGASAAVLVTLASFPLGFLGAASGLWRVPAFQAIRESPSTTTIAAVLLGIGVFALLGCWVALGDLVWHGAARTRTVAVCAAAWAAPLLLSLPLFSKDVFSYLAQGALLARGVNPYVHGVDMFNDWSEFGADVQWAASTTPYGAVWLIVERAIAVTILASGYEGGLLAFRFVAVVGMAVLAWAAWHISYSCGHDPVKTLWAVAACPIMLLSFVVSMHNDALMLAFIAAGVLAALRRRPWLAVLLVTFAVGIKPVALIALPVIGLIRMGERADWRQRLLGWSRDIAVCVGSLTVAVAAMGLGWRLSWLFGSAVPLSIGTWYSPTTVLAVTGGAIASLGGSLSDAAFVVSAVKAVGTGCAVLLGTWVLATRRPFRPEVRLFLAFLAVVALSPVIHPWYLMWATCLGAAAGMFRSRGGAAILMLLTAFLTMEHLMPEASYDAASIPAAAQISLIVLAVTGTMAALAWIAWQWRGELRALHLPALVPAKVPAKVG